MTRLEIINSLKDQARDKESLANGDADSVFAHDARVLLEAAKLLRLTTTGQQKETAGNWTEYLRRRFERVD